MNYRFSPDPVILESQAMRLPHSTKRAAAQARLLERNSLAASKSNRTLPGGKQRQHPPPTYHLDTVAPDKGQAGLKVEGGEPSAMASPGPSTGRMPKFIGSTETSNLQTGRAALGFVERWVMPMLECSMVILGCSGSGRGEQAHRHSGIHLRCGPL